MPWVWSTFLSSWGPLFHRQFYEKVLQVFIYTSCFLKWIMIDSEHVSEHMEISCPFSLLGSLQAYNMYTFSVSHQCWVTGMKNDPVTWKVVSLTSPPGPVMSKPPVPLYVTAPPPQRSMHRKSRLPFPHTFP